MSGADPYAKPRDPSAGFTLIEALVAMAVLAVGAVSLLSAVETQTVRVSDVQDRTVARWVAQNRLTALRLGLEERAARERMMGLDWTVTEERAATPDPALEAVTVRVGPADGVPLVALLGYIPTREDEG
jgi:general secretion pathway protein I